MSAVICSLSRPRRKVVSLNPQVQVRACCTPLAKNAKQPPVFVFFYFPRTFRFEGGFKCTHEKTPGLSKCESGSAPPSGNKTNAVRWRRPRDRMFVFPLCCQVYDAGCGAHAPFASTARYADVNKAPRVPSTIINLELNKYFYFY
jgi:hypothetical protein